MNYDLLTRVYTKEEALLLSPLQLAYIGDSVHALLMRCALITRGLPVAKMHRASVAAVSATAQSRIAESVMPLLSEDEAAIFKKGRNAHARHVTPKSATAAEYAGATGLEALLGFLYLTGQTQRLKELGPYLCPKEENDHA